MKCTFKDCDERGDPGEDVEFFACDGCLDKLEMLITLRQEENDSKEA